LLELSHRDDSNKQSNIGFGEDITQAVPIEAQFMQFICSSLTLISQMIGLTRVKTSALAQA